MWEKLKTSYAYLFYFFYNAVNKVKGNILVQFKALLMLAGLEFIFINSIVNYHLNFNRVIPSHNFDVAYIWITGVFVVTLNFIFFERGGKWKRYLEKFKAWPLEKQSKWDWAMRVIVFFVGPILSI